MPEPCFGPFQPPSPFFELTLLPLFYTPAATLINSFPLVGFISARTTPSASFAGRPAVPGLLPRGHYHPVTWVVSVDFFTDTLFFQREEIEWTDFLVVFDAPFFDGFCLALHHLGACS